jgi:hypothetical protein
MGASADGLESMIDVDPKDAELLALSSNNMEMLYNRANSHKGELDKLLSMVNKDEGTSEKKT